MSRLCQDTADDGRNVDENNLQNRNSRSRQNLMEPEDESPYSMSNTNLQKSLKNLLKSLIVCRGTNVTLYSTTSIRISLKEP